MRSIADSVIHRAGWVLADPWTIFENGYVVVENGLIRAIGKEHYDGNGRIADHGPGVLMPALVNAHTHLELSAFKGKLTFEKGFREWVRQLLTLRNAAGTENLLAGVQDGISELLSAGSSVAGEISTLGLTRASFLQSDLAGVWFQERLGVEAADENETGMNASVADTRKCCSLAGHAPHTTAPNLLKRLKEATRQRHLPLSIHLAESEDETEFLQTGRGVWADFLTERGIDFSGWGLPVASPVKHLRRLGLLGPDTLAVHLISADQEDIEMIHDSGTKVCLCLRSNANLHRRLPNVKAMFAKGMPLCLGTDSLASTGSLSMFDEMAFVGRHFSWLAPRQILAMATINGASALGLDRMFGSLAPGKVGPLIYVSLEAESAASVLEKLVHADFSGSCRLI